MGSLLTFGERRMAIMNEVHDIMSVNELEQAVLVQSERRMTITIDFGEIVEHEVRIVI